MLPLLLRSLLALTNSSATLQKVINLILVAFHACMSTFIAASIIPAYQVMAKDLGRPLQDITYLTSLQIAILGVAPLIWKPISHRYGRRPVFLLSLICSLVGNIGCAKSPGYNSMAVCRAIVAFFISPPAAIGSAVVMETFFKKERARYMGIWTLLVTIGVPLSPFIFGFVAERVGYRWIYWILAIASPPFTLQVLSLTPDNRSTAFNSSSTSSSAPKPATSAMVSRITAPTSSKSTSNSAASIRPPSAPMNSSSPSSSAASSASSSPPSPTP